MNWRARYEVHGEVDTVDMNQQLEQIRQLEQWFEERIRNYYGVPIMNWEQYAELLRNTDFT